MSPHNPLAEADEVPKPTIMKILASSIRRRLYLPVLAFFSITTLCLFIVTSARLGIWIPKMPKVVKRPKVVLRQGRFVGIELNDGYPQVMDAFLGIPYGMSTEGIMRFKPPVRVGASELEFDAGEHGNRCPSLGGGPKQSEDCLNLDLYRRKARNSGDKLPVLVDFHGGAFNGGIGDTSWQVSHLAAFSAEPMIAVSFNYRVGALGFLPSTVMAQEGLLNVGLKDQELLLEWIQENIAAFGGDPDNVTLRGSSAGAHSVGHHLLYNTDRPPPFARAIMESGAATARAVYSYSNPIHELQFREFLKILGCPSKPESEIVTTLRGYSTAEIQAASNKIFNKYNPSVRWPFQPVIDGKGGIIVTRPIDAWKAGKWHKVPILTGYNTNEGAMFVPKTVKTSQEFSDFFTILLPGLREKDISELQEVYPDPTIDPHSPYKETRPGLGAQYKRLEQAYGQFAYIAPVRQTVHYAASGPAPVYLYHFAAESSVYGADHGTHIPFITHTMGDIGKSKTVIEISGTMNAYWTSFITSGDPNKVLGRYPLRRKWPVYVKSEREGGGRKGGEGRILVFGEGNNEAAGKEDKGEVCQLKDDGFAAEESEFWWDRTELFEF